METVPLIIHVVMLGVIYQMVTGQGTVKKQKNSTNATHLPVPEPKQLKHFYYFVSPDEKNVSEPAGKPLEIIKVFKKPSPVYLPQIIRQPVKQPVVLVADRGVKQIEPVVFFVKHYNIYQTDPKIHHLIPERLGDFHVPQYSQYDFLNNLKIVRPVKAPEVAEYDTGAVLRQPFLLTVPY